jgi:hypothetical protein
MPADDWTVTYGRYTGKTTYNVTHTQGHSRPNYLPILQHYDTLLQESLSDDRSIYLLQVGV